jgi:hypothetical protein
MDVSDFTEQYSWLPDSELLALAKQRHNLLPVAIPALESELQRRGFKSGQEITVQTSLPELTRERPYKWGRFVGGMSVVGGVIAFGVGCMQKQWGVAAAGLYNFIVGFGVYEKKKLAVLFAEALNILFALVIVLAIVAFAIKGEFASALIIAVMIVIPGSQLLYFWKRRKELR